MSTFDPRDRRDSSVPSLSRVRLMARSAGYLMVRRPGCIPFVMTEEQWAKLPIYETEAAE